MEHKDLSGRVAMITGESSEIGAATVHALSDRGADASLLARRVDKLSQLAAENQRERARELA